MQSPNKKLEDANKLKIEQCSQSNEIDFHLQAITHEHNFTNSHCSVLRYGSVDVLCPKKCKKKI